MEKLAVRGGPLLEGPLPYVAPFGAFILFLAIDRYLPFPVEGKQALRFAVPFILLLTVSRGVMPRRAVRPWGSVVLGVAVFLIWIGPDVLWPDYRQNWLFRNGIFGAPESSLPATARGSAIFVVFRVLTSVVNVPALEELFWRGWLMRWLITPNFRKVPLGSYASQSFWVVAVLFAVEHGSYWDVGLITGVLYNWWLVRTRSLGDCIIAHAVTNGCLAWYVLARGQWQYWL